MSAKIVVVGSYAVGLVMRTTRLPAKGETVVGHDFVSMHGGKGSNQAIACARLGAQTSFIACVGADGYGRAALTLMHDEGVETSFVRSVADAPTGVGFITVDEAGDNAIAVALGANARLSFEDVDHAEAMIAAADVVLVQLEIPPHVAAHAMAIARRHGVRTILNPAPAQPLSPSDLADVDVLTPNLTEARTLSGQQYGDAQTCGQTLRERGIGTVVVTVGERGAWIIGGTASPVAIPTYEVGALDTTGAGDAFSAALAVALGEGAHLADAVSFACAAGAYSVQSLGTVPSYPTRVQLSAFLETAHSYRPEALR
jgi:ribokinase